MSHKAWVYSLLFAVSASYGSIAENPNGNNHSLLISVSHGLPGLDIDIKNMTEIGDHQSNHFKAAKLADINVSDAAKALMNAAEAPDSRGSFLFYFTGHGNTGVILMEDTTMKISEIRAAIEKGREKWGPLPRLVLIFDSCHSGSLLDPVRAFFPNPTLDPIVASNEMADAITREFTASNGREGVPYWKELFVFASAGADETCEAGEEGSAFTVALRKAWDEVLPANGSINSFIEKTKAYTQGSHPVARLVPTSMGDKKLGRNVTE